MSSLLKQWKEHAASRYPAGRKVLQFYQDHTFSASASIIILLGLIFFSGLVKMLIIGAFFIVLGAFSMIYNRWLKLSIGIELIMLGFIMMTVLYGPIPGIIVGMIALFWAEVMTGRFTYSTVVSFIGIGIVGFLIPLLPFQDNITMLGILATIIYDAIIVPGYILLGSEPWRSFLFGVGHIIFNIWVFFGIAPWLLTILEVIV